MAAPWAENPLKVVVEFCKTAQGQHRIIKLKHSGAVLPPQLAGRVSPQVWGAFMADVEQASLQHPYVVKPSAGRMGSWALAGVLGAVVGCCCINPDGGDYNVWLPQVQGLIDRHASAFAASGCALSLQRAQQSHFIQIDVNPNAPAVGQPVPPTMQPPKPGYEPAPAAPGSSKPV